MVYRIRIIVLFFVMFSCIGATFSQSDWNNIQDLTDYKKELKSLLKTEEKKSNDGDLKAKIGECYYMLNQMGQAQNYFEKAISQNGLNGKYKLQYAKTLMAMGKYAGAKQWFLAYADDEPNVGNHYAAQIDKIDLLKKVAPIFSVKSIKANSAQSEMVVSMVGSDVYVLQNHSTKGKTLKKILADGSTKNVDTGIDLNNVSYFSFSGNGTTVCYSKQNSYVGQRMIPEAGLNDELFIAMVSPTGEWVNSVGYGHNSSGFNCSYPALDFNGSTLYFSSDRADGFGGQDIYMSIKDGNSWSFPVNVGPEVNTPGNEITPFPTSTSLYFSSNWNVGYGSYDIYRAAKSRDGYKKVFHQGSSVNSSRDDYGFTINEKSNVAYFVSNRASGKGLEDVFVANKPDANYVINIKDATSKNSIERVALDLSACGGDQTFTDENGQFVFQLLSDNGCRIRIEKPGYEINFLEVSKSRGREYTVMLESTYPTVIGQVLDKSTGLGLSEVKIAIENMASKEVQNLVTDNSGSFKCQLISGYTYKILYFKDGFESNSKIVNTGTKVSKDVIGSILLTRSANTIATAPTPTKVEREPVTRVVEPTTPNTSNSFNVNTVQAGFAVQLAAIRPSKNIDLNDYANAATIGKEVYIKEGSDYNRIRVGVFNTKAEATAAKSKIISAGYSSAYIVSEEGVTLKSGLQDVYTARSANANSNQAGSYVIRLAALKNMDNVDRNLLNQYGSLETTTSNGLNVLYLVEFDNLNRAKTVKNTLQAKGYPGAFVMERTSNGTLKKVE